MDIPHQIPLHFRPPLPHNPKAVTIQERYENHRAALPWLLDDFAQRALELKRSGWKHYSAKALMEVARFHWNIKKGPDDDFKLNNDFTSRYARDIMKLYPELDGFFELRKLKSE